MTKSTSYPSRPDAVPTSVHWAIITGSSHSDDYGGSSNHLEYAAYTDKAEWEAEITKREKDRSSYRDYVALEVRPAVVERTISVAVK